MIDFGSVLGYDSDNNILFDLNDGITLRNIPPELLILGDKYK